MYLGRNIHSCQKYINLGKKKVKVMVTAYPEIWGKHVLDQNKGHGHAIRPKTLFLLKTCKSIILHQKYEFRPEF